MWKPVAYMSKSMTETECRYLQIEKEALALVWACEKFEDYVLGKEIHLETDHKPLVPLLGKADLDCLLPRILRFQLRFMRFSYAIRHVPVKELCTVSTVLSTLPASTEYLNKYCTAQLADTDVPNLYISPGMAGQSTGIKCLRMCDGIGQYEES